ncbi:hypothetical protein SUGI_1028600 [Cryptomeria japonica]|nr:hypothetical protein SUGI_1028600 [Cryptomeria japonica]
MWICDHTRKPLSLAAVKAPDGSNNEAAFRALYEALKWCKQKNIRDIDIEEDLLIIINAVSSNKAISWKLQQWVASIREILADMDNFSTKHVYREANEAADFLSEVVIDETVSVITEDTGQWEDL